MSIAEAYDMPVARKLLVPPSPPRAPETMTALGRMRVMRESVIATWGQRAYEEDIIRGRFVGRSSFILNTPDAIRHVLVDNYENYTRHPGRPSRAASDPRRRLARLRRAEPGNISAGRWRRPSRRAPVTTLIPHMLAATDDTIAKLRGRQQRAGGFA